MNKIHIKLFLLAGFCFSAPLFSENKVQKCFSDKFQALTYSGSDKQLINGVNAAMKDCGAKGTKYYDLHFFSQHPKVLAVAASVDHGELLIRIFGNPTGSREEQEAIEDYKARENRLAVERREANLEYWKNVMLGDR